MGHLHSSEKVLGAINDHWSHVKRMNFTYAPEDLLPVLLNITKITNDGLIYIEFNQDLIVPPFSDFNSNYIYSKPVLYETAGIDELQWAFDNINFGYVNKASWSLVTYDEAIDLSEKFLNPKPSKKQL